MDSRSPYHVNGFCLVIRSIDKQMERMAAQTVPRSIEIEEFRNRNLPRQRKLFLELAIAPGSLLTQVFNHRFSPGLHMEFFVNAPDVSFYRA